MIRHYFDAQRFFFDAATLILMPCRLFSSLSSIFTLPWPLTPFSALPLFAATLIDYFRHCCRFDFHCARKQQRGAAHAYRKQRRAT